MPKTTREDLPGTLQRSPAKAQRTYAKALDSAYEQYEGNEARARRTAMAAVKHSFEKVGDHWEAKAEAGPSDPQSRKSGREALENPAPTAGGVDVEGHTKEELYERARELGVEGRSRMTKLELGRAIARKQD
jgi:cation transport regulator ChaB